VVTAAERPELAGAILAAWKPTTPNRNAQAAQPAGAAYKANGGIRGRSAWVCATGLTRT
jgi:hypothetical protein